MSDEQPTASSERTHRWRALKSMREMLGEAQADLRDVQARLRDLAAYMDGDILELELQKLRNERKRREKKRGRVMK